MEKRRIGTLEVTVIGLGCNNFGWKIEEPPAAEVTRTALDSGINHFDTADLYGAGKSEEFLGRALGARRSEVIVATKFGMELDSERKGADPAYVKRACNDSLKRLGIAQIDLYWLHKPDPEVPIAETLGALAELIGAGKVREIGASNFSAPQLREAAAAAEQGGLQRFVAVQNELSLIVRDALLPESADNPKSGVIDECVRQGLAFVPFFPLASGLLTGKYRLGQPVPAGSRLTISHRGPALLAEKNLQLIERLTGWIAAYNAMRGTAHSVLDLSFAWLLAQPAVASVIAGATTRAQVGQNAQSAALQLTAQEALEITALTEESLAREA